jgi:3-oxoacyl-[acyl-carrier-protein] synthase-3
MTVSIRSVGKYVPDTIMTNDTLTEWLDTSDEWIRTRTGIHQRHISRDEQTSDLSIKAANQVLTRANISGEEVGIIIVATMTPDGGSPSVACRVQGAIGAKEAMAFDVNAACSGFVYACSIAEKLLMGTTHSYALVLGAEVMSKAINWKDRSTAVLFGDGAGGVLLEKKEQEQQFIGESIHADGTRGDALLSGMTSVENPLVEKDNSISPYLEMSGRDIFDFVFRNVPNNIKEVVEDQQMSLEDVDYFLLHQANARLIQAVAKKLKLPIDRFPMNIEKYGNTSAASLPILLEECIQEGTISLGSGQTIVLTGFGGGLTWGSLLLRV